MTGVVEADYNFMQDPENARKILAEWPTLLLFSPQESGQQFDYTPEVITKDLEAGSMADSPIYHAYTHHNCDTGQRMWDVMTIMPMMSDELFEFEGPFKFYFGEDNLIKDIKSDSPNHYISVPKDPNSGQMLMRLLRAYSSIPELIL